MLIALMLILTLAFSLFARGIFSGLVIFVLMLIVMVSWIASVQV